MNLTKLHTSNLSRFFLVSALVLLCQVLPLSIYANCEDEIDGFEYIGELNNHKYYISQTPLRWLYARDVALSFGGYLAEISSAQENTFILENANALNLTTSAHIGLNDFENEGNLVWSNGAPLFFSNVNASSFNSNENNNAVMDLWTNGGGWSLKSHWSSSHFIMEIPCDELTPESNVEILSYACPDVFPTSGALISFTVEVQNLGTTPSAPQNFGFYQELSSEQPYADDLIGQAFLDVLQPNEVGTVLFANVPMPDPFFFPSFSTDETQWGIKTQWREFYIKKFLNPSGTSLNKDDSFAFDIYCKKYSTDISASITDASYEYGDEGIINYKGEIVNNGPETAYNVKAIVGKTLMESIPSIETDPFIDVLTFDDADETKMICIDELGVGETIEISFFQNIEPILPDTIPDSLLVSILTFSQQLIDPNPNNNTISEYFYFNPFVSDDCPGTIPGYLYLGQYNDNRFFLSDEAVHWWEADSLANEAGGELSAIETVTENNFLKYYLDESAWIGLSDDIQEQEFIWSGGDSMSYNNLQGINNEILDFVSFNHWNGAWVLNKAPVLKKYVIEVPCNLIPGAFVDLEVSNIVLNQTTAEQDELIDFTFDLTNNGNSDAANEFMINFYISADNTLDADDPHIGDILTGFWGKNYSENVFAQEMAIPWNLLLGDYHIIVTVDHEYDGTNILFDENAINNTIVSEQTITVTGNPCTISPSVEGGTLMVEGIPQGNSFFVLYGPSQEIISSFTCSYDCPAQIEVTDLADGDYSISFFYFEDDWTLNCSSYPIDFTVILGDLSGMISNSSLTAVHRSIPFELLPINPINTQPLYPNPANDHIIATVESYFDYEASLEIYDINGRLISSRIVHLQSGIQSLDLDISNLSNGIHHLNIKSNNKILSTQRFIKI